MKKAASIIAVALGLFILDACGNNAKNGGGTADSTGAAAIDSTSKDTTSKIGGAVTKIDTGFVHKAASGGLTEVALGKLAQQKGLSDAVKNFGKMMVMDHSKANDTLAALAQAKKILIPNAPDPGHQATIDKLMKLDGADFDRAYMADMVDDHKNDIKSFEFASKNCKDPDIRAFAQKTLPVLRKHLEAAKSIDGNLKKPM